MIIAQTNIQLYNQLRRQNRGPEELQQVHRAYEFMTTIYAGYVQSDGKPFLAHSIGVASGVAACGAPTEIVIAGLSHNIYGNGDFGDGRIHRITKLRRKIVREGLGERVEDLAVRFHKYRITGETIDDISARLDEFDTDERYLLLIDLADHLEKYIDFGVLYFGESEWARTLSEANGDKLVDIANRLGYPELGSHLAEVFAAVVAEEAYIPKSLRSSDGRKFLKLVVPRSCKRRAFPYLVSRVKEMMTARA